MREDAITGAYAIVCHRDGTDIISNLAPHDKEGITRAKRIAGCVKGCLGIEDPETTVPELVAVCNKLSEAIEEASQYKEHDDLVAEALAILAKTKTT